MRKSIDSGAWLTGQLRLIRLYKREVWLNLGDTILTGIGFGAVSLRDLGRVFPTGLHSVQWSGNFRCNKQFSHSVRHGLGIDLWFEYWENCFIILCARRRLHYQWCGSHKGRVLCHFQKRSCIIGRGRRKLWRWVAVWSKWRWHPWFVKVESKPFFTRGIKFSLTFACVFHLLQFYRSFESASPHNDYVIVKK